MTSPHNRYRSAPPPAAVGPAGPGPLSQLGSLAAQKALTAGINTAIPGGGFAAELATDAIPMFFNEGGEAKSWLEKAAEYAWKNKNLEEKRGRWAKTAEYKAAGGAPLGGGQSKEGLVEARRLGALTQAEFLKAMAHAGYMNAGGKVKMGPLAGMKYKYMSEGGEVHEHERKYHNPLAGGSSEKKEG